MRFIVLLLGAVLGSAAAPANATLVYQRNATNEIVVARDDGSHRTVVAHGRGPVLSPDGKNVAFITGRDPYKTALRVVSTRGGKSRRLARRVSGVTPPDSIAWSPNSRYLTVGGLGREEYIVDLLEATRRTVDLRDLPSQRSFSPDSARLLIEVVHPSDSEIDVVSTRHGGAHILSSGEGPAWGQDGFAFQDFQSGIVFRRSLSAKRQELRAKGHASPVEWSADGDVLLAAGGQAPDQLRALLINRQTHKTRFLSQRFSAIEDLSQNGRAVLGEHSGKVLTAWRDGTVKTLARDATTPSWTK